MFPYGLNSFCFVVCTDQWDNSIIIIGLERVVLLKFKWGLGRVAEHGHRWGGTCKKAGFTPHR